MRALDNGLRQGFSNYLTAYPYELSPCMEYSLNIIWYKVYTIETQNTINYEYALSNTISLLWMSLTLLYD